ncbi:MULTISPECIES: helix-turn-helix domain-containing protein [Alphaproteobacteria]|uniref:Chromosomal replication initiator DnaA C-terminal domain-containing protein n=2 Tax=Alphaproteobacteria TaxID=28211 RepID=A0A512HFV1_9HYPH|nr:MULTISPECIES: helix-turn-helix domain-containing protein [Alphaproteobacteria]GEO84328.1 hypothetical protein RNA01_12600 [Ciceribacter naphthalenivorans]GLR24865.1 hypothetical protein GCM10007920_46590 [Ciceribacter naphthalenivorans]GLT07721.1 hypothetical protein GCM10007926_46590 [Sphingomonas psychrolutea]
MPSELPLSPASGLKTVSPETLVSRSVPSALSDRRLVCLVVRQITSELLALTGEPGEVGRARRRACCHVRQISMYVCHVALSMSYGDIAECFCVDRTTVTHACHMVENRRDDPGFDIFVGTVERLAEAVGMVAGRSV